MKGILIKDLLMIKNNYKALIISIVIYIFYGLMFNLDVSFLLPLMGIMCSFSTFAYDDLASFHTYASSFPKGRINIVKSKYIVSIAITLAFTLVSLLFGFILNNKDFSIEGTLGATSAFIIIMAIIFPIMFKYGAEKGRIAMMVVGFGLGGIGLLLSKLPIKVPVELVLFLNNYGIYLVIFIVLASISISYLISKKIYLNKEF